MVDVTKPDIEFVYVADPMCSWCWGFAPVVERMGEVYAIPMRLLVGGLRPGPEAEELDDRLERLLAHHWELVEERSGQPFDHAFLTRRDGWVYDTEFPARAVVTMRSLDPTLGIPFHSRLQRAFYAEGVDITDPAVYPGLLAEFDVEGERFMQELESPESRKRAWQDFAEARRMGVSGFPTLVVRDGDQWSIVTRGFAPADDLLPVLSDWLLTRHADVAEGDLLCTPGVVC